MSVRSPAVANQFYPGDARDLQRSVRSYLASAVAQNHHPKALIVPHAGYIYSGPVAASAYVNLQASARHIRRVVLLGPSHRVPLKGMAVSSADFFSTPLGQVPVDQNASQKLLTLPGVQRLDAAHALEHSLEVQLPFLQEILPAFSLLPLVVGDCPATEVAAVLEYLWGTEETLIVVSSDLSHYHDYDTARAMDRQTSLAIEALAPERIHYADACGRAPLNGLLLAARTHGLHAHTLDLRNSGDTAGSRDQVVGYGAYLLE